MYLNIRYGGQSHEIPIADLDIGEESTDLDVKRAAADYVADNGNGDHHAIYEKIADFVVDRNQDSGDITVRASAVFGSEDDHRLEILQTLLKCPHRDIDSLMPTHKELEKKDPLFYRSLAAWYLETGEVRDNKDTFVIRLCLSTFEGSRDVGLAMLRELPPHRISKITSYISKNNNLPRSFKTEVSRYIREREKDPNWFDRAVLRARKDMKLIYKATKTAPSERAQSILFDGEIPEDSVLHCAKQIMAAKTPAEQAAVIIENKIPFTTACSVVKAFTPTTLLAIVNNMSDQEIVNSIGMLKKHGAFNNKELKDFINERIKSAKKISTLKSSIATQNVGGLDGEIAKSLDNKATEKIKGKANISKNTAILVDKSGSMDQGIEVGKRIAEMVSTACTGDVFVYAYDGVSYELTDKSCKTLGDWNKKFSGISAGGGTACASTLNHMIKNNVNVDQLVIVTDQGDARVAMFKNCLLKIQQNNPMLEVVIVNISTHWGGNDNRMYNACIQNEIPCQQWNYDNKDSDYYSLPELLPLIAGGNMMDLVTDIIAWKLPKRKTC